VRHVPDPASESDLGTSAAAEHSDTVRLATSIIQITKGLDRLPCV
jgi:hypothetical protein